MSISSHAASSREAARGPGGKFGEQPRSEAEVDLADGTPPGSVPVGEERDVSGFRYSRYREDRQRSEETPAFTADIEFDGVRVGSVVNDGQGGADRIMFDDQETSDAFDAAASRHFGDGSPWAAQEDMSLELATRAHLAAALNRKRKVVATREGDPSPWSSGQVFEFNGSREELAQVVEGDGHSYRVWDKKREDFVPLPGGDQ